MVHLWADGRRLPHRSCETRFPVQSHGSYLSWTARNSLRWYFSQGQTVPPASAGGLSQSGLRSVMMIFLGNALGYFFNYLFFAAKSRQMRVVTPIEGIRFRFGKVNEQVFTWASVPSSIFQAGIWLNGLAIFVSAVFDIPMSTRAHWSRPLSMLFFFLQRFHIPNVVGNVRSCAAIFWIVSTAILICRTAGRLCCVLRTPS